MPSQAGRNYEVDDHGHGHGGRRASQASKGSRAHTPGTNSSRDPVLHSESLDKPEGPSAKLTDAENEMLR